MGMDQNLGKRKVAGNLNLLNPLFFRTKNEVLVTDGQVEPRYTG